WATVWRGLIRDEALRTKIKTDPHSPGQVRGYAPLMHVDAFYTAFDVQEGDSMYIAPENRVRIWYTFVRFFILYFPALQLAGWGFLFKNMLSGKNVEATHKV